jgi:hypothetical protein
MLTPKQMMQVVVDTLFYIGGIDPNGIQDNNGPEVKLTCI